MNAMEVTGLKEMFKIGTVEEVSKELSISLKTAEKLKEASENAPADVTYIGWD